MGPLIHQRSVSPNKAFVAFDGLIGSAVLAPSRLRSHSLSASLTGGIAVLNRRLIAARPLA